jgi:hypothetical protein
MGAGPRIHRDGLALGFDTGRTTVDDNTFNYSNFLGEPTVNYTTDTPSQGGWTGTYSVLDSSLKKFRFNVSNFSANPGSGWRSFTWDLRAYTGQSVTISATVEVPDLSPGTFAWVMMGQGNTHTNTSGAGGYMGYSAASERVQKTTTTKEHITWSGTLGNSGTASSPSGHVGFTVWYNNGVPGVNSFIEVSDVQIELKSHETPFVNGTRSDTASLIDLNKTVDIDAGYISFDSTGQPEMDGTSDYVDLGSDLGISPINQGWTAEYVFNTDSASTLQHFNGCEESVHNAGWLALLSSKLAVWDRSANVWKYGSTQFASDTWYHIAFIQESGTSMQFYVNGVAEGGDHASFAWTASKSAFFARYVGKYAHPANSYGRYFNGHIPVARLYNVPLTAAEVKQNYEAYKNRFNLS